MSYPLRDDAHTRTLCWKAVFPCIDYQFAALGGPTAASSYWSASNSATSPFFAWGAGFSDGFVGHFGLKEGDSFVRAVRAG